MKNLCSLWLQLKLIIAAAFLLFLILFVGIVLPNWDSIGSSVSSSNGTDLNEFDLHSSLVIISNITDPINLERQEFISSILNSTWFGNYARAKSILDNRDSTTQTNETYLEDNSLLMSMSTLWILGLKEEFYLTWDLVAQNYLDPTSKYWHHSSSIHVQSTVSEVMGSMLACFALTGEQQFLDAAKNISDRLAPAYDNSTGMLLLSSSDFTKTKPPFLFLGFSYPHFTSFESIATLSEVGGQSLEYRYLSGLINDSTLVQTRIDSPRTRLFDTKQAEGFYAERLFVPSGIWASSRMSLFSQTSSFYTGLIKSYIQSGEKDSKALQMYIDAIDTLNSLDSLDSSAQQLSPADGLFGISKTALTFVREYDYHNKHPINGACMQSDGCYLGAMLALGVNEFQKMLPENETAHNHTDIQRIKQHIKLAEAITETCYQASIRSVEKLLPEKFCFNDRDEATFVDETAEWEGRKGEGNVDLRPGLAESYFIFDRNQIGHEEKYQTQAWQMAQAIDKYIRDLESSSNQILDSDCKLA